MLSALGDGSEVSNQRWRSPVPEVEDEGKGGVVGRPAWRGSVWGSRMKRRSSWACPGGEGEAVAAVVLVGGDGCVRVDAREGDRGGDELEGEVEASRGCRGAV